MLVGCTLQHAQGQYHSVQHGVMQTVVSNATRWDTFEYLMDQQALPRSEQLFRERYKKSPSFISIHMGVKADVLPKVSFFPGDHIPT